MSRYLFFAVASLFVLISCRRESATNAERGALPLMTLQSRAFATGAAIPKPYSCDGPNISPPLNWQGVPSDPETGAKSLAIICRDADAPKLNFAHWVLWNLPPAGSNLPESLPNAAKLPTDARQGTNSFGKIGYSGPCPPKGQKHRYYFDLYALDTTLDLPPTTTREQLLAAMQKHILAEGQVMGTFKH